MAGTSATWYSDADAREAALDSQHSGRSNRSPSPSKMEKPTDITQTTCRSWPGMEYTDMGRTLTHSPASKSGRIGFTVRALPGRLSTLSIP